MIEKIINNFDILNSLAEIEGVNLRDEIKKIEIIFFISFFLSFGFIFIDMKYFLISVILSIVIFILLIKFKIRKYTNGLKVIEKNFSSIVDITKNYVNEPEEVIIMILS